MKRLRWRKQANETGLARVTQGVRGYDAGRPIVARVRHMRTGRWYWYGGGYNSINADVSFATGEEAKADAEATINGKKSDHI